MSGGYSEDNTQELQELFEERLGRPMGSPAGSRFGVGADKMMSQQRNFEFEVDAEMIIYGVTKPNSHITLAGTPVKLRPDGSFSARLSLPDRRQVLPVVASSPDGVEQRTVVLAVERKHEGDGAQNPRRRPVAPLDQERPWTRSASGPVARISGICGSVVPVHASGF